MDLRIAVIFALLSCALSQNEGTTEFETTETPPTTLNTTSAPSNTTTSTTTSAPDTTTATTTTVKPAPTTVAPTVKYFYNVTAKDGSYCIMLDGKFSFNVTYNIGKNITRSAGIVVPEPSVMVNVTGACNGMDGSQYIKVSWGDSIEQNYMKMTFVASNESTDWRISQISSKIYMDKANFINATDAGNSVISMAALVTSPYQIPFNHSFMCYASLHFDNFTTKMDDAPYAYPIHLTIDGVQIQAFNHAKGKKFMDEIHCEADKIADIVPIAVGCALGVLVLIVLVAYIIGRRRRSAAYQSV